MYSTEHKVLSFSTPHGLQTVYVDTQIPPSAVKSYDHILIVVDERLHNHATYTSFFRYLKSLGVRPQVTTISINNFTKDSSLALSLIDAFAEAGLTRHSLVIGVGGGSTQDIVGVCAAIYMRGIDYGIVPTTFISMADGIIGKVAANHGGHKNLIGAFKSPVWTWIDTSFLSKEAIGFAHGGVEIWKQAIITKTDAIANDVVELLASNTPTDEQLRRLITWSLHTKSQFVIPDWDDVAGVHKALSLGHTLANILEMRTVLHHAEAVLCGIMFESILAYHRNLIDEEYFNALLAVAWKFNKVLKSYRVAREALKAPDICQLLLKDKISSNKTIKFVVPTMKGYQIIACEESEIARSINVFLQLQPDESYTTAVITA